MFQFAAALALRGTSATEILLSTASLNSYKVPRAFDMLRLLELPAGCHTDLFDDVVGSAAATLLRLRIGRIIPHMGVNDNNFSHHLSDRHFGRSQKLLWLDGYFQRNWHAQMFNDVRNGIQLMVRTDLPVPQSGNTDCVIHIRGGDFLESEVHRVVDTTFYVSALKALRNRIPTIRTVVVVTDDVKYASPIVARLEDQNSDLVIYIAPRAATATGAGWLEDFIMLRDARARVIGNSSFAWWAAALDRNCAPTVSPSQWIHGVTRDLFLPWEITIAV